MATEPDGRTVAVTVRVPGKVNLHLGVGAVGADGYHPVVTVLQAVSVFDEVTASSADGVTVSVGGEGGAGEPSTSEVVPLGPDNLAARAARLLDTTGLDAGELRARAGDPALLAAVLGFLEAHEPDLVACAGDLGVSPAALVTAHARLEGA